MSIVPTNSPGVGITKPISSVSLFSEVFITAKHKLVIEYHGFIWQVSRSSPADAPVKYKCDIQ